MSTLPEDQAWETLFFQIRKYKCTPVIGDGVLRGSSLDHASIAQRLAHKYNYPLLNSARLPRVTQFASALSNYALLKDEVVDLLKSEPPINTKDPYDIHNVLASLPLPVYITTNYDSRMFHALQAQEGKAPRRDFYRWYPLLQEPPSALDKVDASTPLVYHLYGHDEVSESLVLTEDDYLDYLFSIGAGEELPSHIQRVLSTTSLLFMGYRLDSLSFRVLLRSIIQSVMLGRRPHLAIQLNPAPDTLPDKSQHTRYLNYLERCLQGIPDIQVTVYWCSVQRFAKELRDRWEGKAR